MNPVQREILNVINANKEGVPPIGMTQKQFNATLRVSFQLVMSIKTRTLPGK